VFSVIVPVYRNEAFISDLIAALRGMEQELGKPLEAVFVVDGSPDRSYEFLREQLPAADINARLILLTRNFGSFPAIRAGLQSASGPYYAVMAADLQEPPELIVRFFRLLEDEPIDVVVGTREGRSDPLFSRWAAQSFWYLYRKFVVPEMPVGGVDVFGCNQAFRDQLLRLEESHSSLVAQIFWLGFRRRLVGYTRRERKHGKSAWTFRKRLNYLLDSLFAFTDLPIKALIGIGGLAFALAAALSLAVIIARLLGLIDVPGYAAIMLAVLFFGTLNVLGLGLVGSYAWRAYENTKRRPIAIPLSVESFGRSPY
jgi:glycosyltransferase involved in cell wall biosynthesis